MKPNLFKSLLTILLALIISQQSTHAQQAYNSSKVQAQSTIYLMVDELNKAFSNVDFGGISIDETKYDGLIFTWIYSVKGVDVRFMTSDFVILQLHSLFTNPEKRENFEQISSILRQAESKLQMTFRDDAGHEISHTLSPDDIDELMTKSIEELGIDKEQMANYCIFYYNNILQHQIDGTEILNAKAIKEGNFVKLIYTTSYNNNAISILTSQLIKELYISSIGSKILVDGLAYHLKAFGFDGLILEYTNLQGASAEAIITIDDLLHFYDDYILGSADTQNTFEPLNQDPFIIQAVKDYDLEFKEGIGVEGVVDAYAQLEGEYIEITEVLDGITDDISNYIPEEETKEIMFVLFAKNKEALNEFEQLQQHGLKGLIFTYINQTDTESCSITLDFAELFEFTKTFNQDSNTTQKTDSNIKEYVASLSEEEKNAYNELFINAIEMGAKSHIGTNGIKDVYTYTSGEYVSILFSVTNITELSNSEIATLKAEMIRSIQENEDSQTALPIFQLTSGLKGIKYIYKGDNTYKSATITIDFDEIINFSEESLSADGYDPDFNIEDLVNEIISVYDSELKAYVGQDGLIDVNTTLSNNLIESTFIFDSSIDINEVSDLNDLKNDLIRDMTATQDDLDSWSALYYLGIEGFKFNFKNQGSSSGKWFSITIEDVINGIENIDAIPLNEI